MNPYYHSFVLGWNWFYLSIPAAFVLAFVLGKKRFVFSSTAKKVVRYIHEATFTAVSFFLASMLTLEIYLETHHGIIQFMDNLLTTSDNAAWSPILMFFVLFALIVILTEALYYFTVLGGRYVYWSLSEITSEDCT